MKRRIAFGLGALAAIGLIVGLSVATRKRGPADPSAGRVLAFEIPPERPNTTYLRALVFGDSGTGLPDQLNVAQAMLARARREGAPLDLIVTTGDLFYPTGVESISDPQWQTKYEDVYTDELAVPCYSIFGNHDYDGSLEAQYAYEKHNSNWHLPARYYTFSRPLGEGASVQFFMLDTTPIPVGEGDPEQVAWLSEELGKSEATWKIVVGHHPLYSHGKRPYNQWLIPILEPIFVEHDVDLYMAGHDHLLELLKPIQGVYHLVSGAAAGASKAHPARWTNLSHFVATGDGFVWLRLARDELVIEFCRLGGVTQYAHVISKRKGS